MTFTSRKCYTGHVRLVIKCDENSSTTAGCPDGRSWMLVNRNESPSREVVVNLTLRANDTGGYRGTSPASVILCIRLR